MEVIGMALYAIVAGACAAALAAGAMGFTISRPYALAILLTPPVAVILFFFCGWSILYSGPVCGPDPEWDRCPTSFARVLGWSCWVAATLLTAFGAYWTQKILEAAISLRSRSAPIHILHDDPNS